MKSTKAFSNPVVLKIAWCFCDEALSIPTAWPRRAEEERAFRPPWEDGGDVYNGRSPVEGYGGASRGFDDDRWVPHGGPGVPPPPQRAYGRPPPVPRFGTQDRFSDFPPFPDAVLFPPPPPPARQPPPPPRTDAAGDHGGDGKSAVVDPEREAFLAELDRVAQDLEKVTLNSGTGLLAGQVVHGKFVAYIP